MRSVGHATYRLVSFLLFASFVLADAPTTDPEALAGAAFERHDFRAAISAFDEAIRLKPTVAEYIGRGSAKGLCGDLKGGIDDLTIAIKSQPEEYYFLLAHSVRGKFYYAAGDFNHAILDLTTALDADPNYYQALYGRANVWLAVGDGEMAIADTDALISMKPNVPEYYGLRSFGRQANKDWQGAITDADKAVSLDPNQIRGYVARGFARIGSTEYEKALDDFNRAIQIDEKTCDFAIRGKCILLTTCPQQACRDQVEAIRLAKNRIQYNDLGESRRISFLATVYAQTGDFENAIAWQQKAVASAPPERVKAETCRLERFKQKLPLYAPDGSDIDRAFSEWR